jgi:hypothetical protein
MKILLYGENWEGTHVDSISKVLNKKEIPNVVFDFYKHLNYNTKSIFLNKILRRLFYLFNEFNINKKFLQFSTEYEPSLIILSKGINIYPSILRKIKKSETIICNWNPDDFFNDKNSSRHLKNSFELYDIVFSAREHLFSEYYNNGFKKMIYLEWYYIPWLHHLAIASNIEMKISFIGTRSLRREKILESIDSSFLIDVWGSGWSFSKLNSKENINITNRVLPQKDFPQIISNSLVNLNILTVENRDLTNLKIFEIVASGGMILTEDNIKSRAILGNYGFYYEEKTINKILKQIFEMDPVEWELSRKLLVNHVLNNANSISDRVNELLILAE